MEIIPAQQQIQQPQPVIVPTLTPNTGARRKWGPWVFTLLTLSGLALGLWFLLKEGLVIIDIKWKGTTSDQGTPNTEDPGVTGAQAPENDAYLLLLNVKDKQVTYSTIETMEDGSLSQNIFVGDIQTEDYNGFGVSSYPNTKMLSSREWISDEWDPQNLMIVEDLAIDLENAALIKDANAWAEAQETLVADFPALVVISTENRIFVVDRLSGLETTPSQILTLIESLHLP